MTPDAEEQHVYVLWLESQVKVMKKWLILMVLPLLICELSIFSVWYMDHWFHSNSNNISKVQIQCSSHQEYKS